MHSQSAIVADPPKRSGVFGALDDLDGDVSYSLKLAEELGLKLSGLLRRLSEKADDAAADGSVKPRNVSPGTDEVERINNRVRTLNVALSDLPERLDV